MASAVGGKPTVLFFLMMPSGGGNARGSDDAAGACSATTTDFTRVSGNVAPAVAAALGPFCEGPLAAAEDLGAVPADLASLML